MIDKLAEIWKSISEWGSAHEHLLWVLGISSLVVFVGSLIAIPFLIARLPQDYFVRERRPHHPNSVWANPQVAMISFLVKNILGVLLVLAGIAMLVLPGQGVLTILIGMSLMNFPGKRALELRIIRQRQVHQAITWIRAKAHRPPLELPAE